MCTIREYGRAGLGQLPGREDRKAAGESRRSWRKGARAGAALAAIAALLCGNGARATEEEASLREEARIPGLLTRQERPFGFVTDPPRPARAC